jgi:hypothetical protein
MYQQLLGYKVEEKLYLGVREQKRLNTTGVQYENFEGRKKVKITKLSCYTDIAKSYTCEGKCYYLDVRYVGEIFSLLSKNESGLIKSPACLCLCPPFLNRSVDFHEIW